MVTKHLVFAFFSFLALPTLAWAQSSFLIPIPSQQSLSEVYKSTPNIDIDLIIEANTYVPYFYQGRREPAAGSSLRATALTLGASIIPTSYLWEVGGQKFTSSVPYLDFVMPQISGDLLISVTAVDVSGRRLGSASQSIRPATPKVLFYENNELRGLSQIAIGESLPLIGNAISVRAEPYFFGVRSLISGATGTWGVRGIDVVVDTNWREVALLRREGEDYKKTNVQLDVRNRNNLSEGISGSFELGL